MGMSQLSYFCAMESKWISVINGKEKGGTVGKIRQAVEPDFLPFLKSGFHLFLDNLTGDLYDYN